MSARLLLLPLLALLGGRVASSYQLPSSQRYAGPWLGDVASLLQDCPRNGRAVDATLRDLARCARRRALAAIDHILDNDDTVPLVDGLQLVKYQSPDARRTSTNNSVTLSVRDLLKRIRERDRVDADEGGEEEGGWRAKLMKRLARVLKTHVIKIDMERLGHSIANSANSANSARSGAVSQQQRQQQQQQQIEPRGRRRRRRQMHMMPIVMMGVLLMGSVLIPMGFQFLAVLGGKALILAKMALMLSSIQGLKKIATNGVNYGLYHSPVPEPWHERSTAGIELPSTYAALNHAAYALPAPHSAGYLDPASLGYLANRRSATDSALVLQNNT